MILEPLTVPGQPDAITQLLDYVAFAAAAAGLDEQRTYRLCLAVDEIATNIVHYAYDHGRVEGEITIAADQIGEALVVVLEDSGPPFDPREAPAPGDLDRPLEERKDGGLGIYLALWGVDEFRYERAAGINRSTFVVRPA
jgi:anti-sigma regulatory factor (Ser/Thr protein kinase)